MTVTDADDLPEHVRLNRASWDRAAAEYVGPGERAWATDEPAWGIFGVPEAEVGFFRTELADKDVIELGCGTGYVSAWIARRGGRPVGIDNSPRQLEAAARFQRAHGLSFPLLLGNAESVPYPDASFDVAVSEYGASLWADPYAWVPEAARLLRPGGRLVFLTNSLLAYLCVPDTEAEGPADERLKRPMFGMHRITWPDDETGAVEFHLAHGGWIRLLRSSGFDVEDLVELQPPQGSTTTHPWMSLDWARRWPCEEVWVARKRS